MTGAPFPANLIFHWNRRSRPGTGAYPLGGSGQPTVSLVKDPTGASPIGYSVTGGTLRIDHSNRFTLVGRIEMTVRSSTGVILTMAGTFGAGCVSGIC